jgi:hypothetical protein
MGFALDNFQPNFYFQSQKSVHLDHIQLPDISTVLPFPFRFYETFIKKSAYGLHEQGSTLFFYQIDYYGDIFVFEWNSIDVAEWVKFTIEGDCFEVNLQTDLGCWEK